MIIRVDEFPRCDDFGQRIFNVWTALDEFRAALNAPFCLGVVFGEGEDHWARATTIPRLAKLDGVYLAYHGWRHLPLCMDTAPALAKMRDICNDTAVAIPPKNQIDQPTVARLKEAGFTHVCTGPETRRDCPEIRFVDIREVPSAWYRKLRDDGALLEGAPLGQWDCVTLHMCWERSDVGRFNLLRAFAQRYRSEIKPWPEFLAATT